MKAVFVGTGEIGVPSLQWLIDSDEIDLLAVVCQPDKPVGRKQALTPPETKALAEKHGIPVRQPERIRNDADWFEATSPDLIVVMAYGQILPKRILDAPEIACLNLHASILPRHRGASPIQAAIRDGDAECGVTAMYMDEGLDTGDILCTRSFALAKNETGGSLHDRLAGVARDVLEDAVRHLVKGKPPRTPQDGFLATHSRKLKREDGVIDWSLPAIEIERLVRAYDPWPGTSTALFVPGAEPKVLKVYPPTAVVPLDTPEEPGKIVRSNRDSWVVATGRDALEIRNIQPRGKRKMTVEAFIKGNCVPDGSLLGGA